MARIPLAVAMLALAVPAAPADAARYVAQPEAGGQVAFELERGRLLSAEASSRCAPAGSTSRARRPTT